MSAMMAVVAKESENESNGEGAPKKKVVEIKSLPQWYKHSAKHITKKTCGEFLAQTRGFLCDDGRRDLVRPILNLWDWNKISAEDCIRQLIPILIQWEANKALEQSIEKTARGNWTVEIRSEGKEILTKSFATETDASGWAYRRLIENASDAEAIITAKLEKTILIVDRHTAIWKLRAVVKHPYMKISSSTGGGLGFGHKARDSKVHFSHG